MDITVRTIETSHCPEFLLIIIIPKLTMYDLFLNSTVSSIHTDVSGVDALKLLNEPFEE